MVKVLPTKPEALICPSCGRTAMTATERFSVGPLFTRPCRECGVRLSTPWWTGWFVQWPFVVGSAASLVLPRALAACADGIGLPMAITMVVMLVVPVALLTVGVAWGSMRMLDVGQRVALVVKTRRSEKRDA